MKHFADACLKLLPRLRRVKRLVLTKEDVFVNGTEEACNEQLKLLLLLSLLFASQAGVFDFMKDH